MFGKGGEDLPKFSKADGGGFPICRGGQRPPDVDSQHRLGSARRAMPDPARVPWGWRNGDKDRDGKKTMLRWSGPFCYTIKLFARPSSIG